MKRKVFKINGKFFSVTETKPGRYYCNVGGFTKSGYRTVPGVHKDVLLSFLDDAGRTGVIDAATANWAEAAIVEVTAGDA